jgi:5-methylcytosine-specific restriction protein A
VFVAAVLVDHVVPHKGDRVLFWQRCNWQSSCQWHHDVIKQRLETRYAEGGLADADLRLDSAAAVALTQQMSTPYPPSKL